MSDPVKSKPSDHQKPILWENENFTASIDGTDTDGDGCDSTRNADAEVNITVGPKGIFSKYASINGTTKFSKNLRFSPLACKATNLKKAGPTSAGFDEVFALVKLTSLFEYLSNMELDIAGLMKVRHGDSELNPLKANVNTDDSCNAWYSPTAGDLTFGTCEKMHTAACGDIVAHEFGHWLLDKLNPKLLEPTDVISDSWWPVPHKLYAGEQDAIHEGFADAFAAIFHGNPVISEDSWVFTGKKPGSGLRTVENKAKRRSIGSEAHERGLVYGGFFWSLYKRIEGIIKKSGKTEDASFVAVSLMWEHALHYRVAHPNTDQFVDAMLAGANALFNAEKVEIDPFALRDAILDEAFSRELIDATYVAARKTRDGTDLPDGFMLQGRKDFMLRSADDAKKELARDGRTDFDDPQVSWTAAGTHAFYQQVFITKDAERVEVLGNGLVVEKVNPKGMRFKRGGEFVHVFTDGVRNLSGQGSVNETVKCKATAAIESVRREIASRAKKAASKLSAEKAKPQGTNLQRLRIGMLSRDKKALAEAKELILEGFCNGPRLVLLPGAKSLSWRIRVKDIVGYVDAITGKATLVRNYIID